MKKEKKCDRNCFECQYDDCVLDELTHEDYVELAERDREMRWAEAPQKKKLASQHKAYYEANREKLAARQKAYREANREKVAAQKKALFIHSRKEHGYTQAALAALCGVSQPTISKWESGSVPFDPALVGQWLPELLEGA